MAAAEGVRVLEDGKVMDKFNIAIALNEGNANSVIAPHFGRSEYFLLYNSEECRKILIKNPYCKICGGAGIQAAQFLIEKDVDVLIVGQVGTNAYVILESAGIKVIYQGEKTAEAVLKDFIRSKTKEVKIKIHS